VFAVNRFLSFIKRTEIEDVGPLTYLLHHIKVTSSPFYSNEEITTPTSNRRRHSTSNIRSSLEDVDKKRTKPLTTPNLSVKHNKLGERKKVRPGYISAVSSHQGAKS
jgi:hypothetical protein